MWEKGAIVECDLDPAWFVSNLCFVVKKDGGSRPVINLKLLNAYISYEHFKMRAILIQNTESRLERHLFRDPNSLSLARSSVPLPIHKYIDT